MNDYSYRDIMRMQEEAKARVMEMQRRSRFLAEDFAGGEARAESGERSESRAECGERRAEMRPEPHARAIRMPVELPEASAEFGVRNSELRQGAETRTTERSRKESNAEFGMRNSELRQGTGLSAALRNVFGDLSGEEAEKMFLLALCLLLHQENGDEGLLMAMMYLLT